MPIKPQRSAFCLGLCRSLLALLVVATFAPAHAEDDNVQLAQPDSSVSAGVALLSGNAKDRALFGQYNGLRRNGSDLLLDVDIAKRDDASGSWMLLQGRNLGLDNRDLNAAYIKQGDWKVAADYSELVRHDPRSINTGLIGAGSAQPTVVTLATPGTGTELNLEQKRKGLGFAAEKWLAPNWLFEASFKNETKQGARLSGRGIACGVYASANQACGTTAATAAALFAATAGATLLLPEPIAFTTRQFDAGLTYVGAALKANLGYSGSSFSNGNSSLSPNIGAGMLAGGGTVVGGTATLLDLMRLPVALPPDNQAQQVYAAGNYAFSPTTRATFKLSHSRATQHDDFAGTALSAPLALSNLGGVVDSTLAQFGLTARPLSKLSLLANLRYDERDDKTPYALLTTTTNAQNSSRKLGGKLEASYQLPDNYRATLGVDYLEVNRARPVGTTVYADAGFSGLREQTRELGYRAELRRSMAENLNAMVSYSHSRRDGSSWLMPTVAGFPAVADAAITNSNGAFPTTLEDRQRDKLKVIAEWTLLESLSLQFFVEDGKDSYRAPSEKGLRDSGVRNLGIDAAWKLSDTWKLGGYWNRGYQTQHINHSIGYLAELGDYSTSIGLSLAGKLAEKLELGGDLTHMDESNRYQQSLSSGAALIGGGLPDVNYRLLRLKLFAKYALEKNADLQLNLIHQRSKLDEWTWSYAGVPFVSADNSSVALQPSQNVGFVGLTYIYTMK